MKTIFTFLLSALFISVSSAQSNSVYGYVDSENAAPITISAMVEGESNHFYNIGVNSLTFTPYIFKTDANGNIIWQKTFTTPSDPYAVAQKVRYHNNHVYVIFFANYPTIHYILYKLDQSGNTIWTKNLTTLDNYYGYHLPGMDFTPNNDIVVSSSTFSRVELFSLDENGNTNWIRDCGEDSSSWKNPNFDICCTEEGDIMGCCKRENDMCFYRMNADGSSQWSKRIQEFDQTYTHIKSIEEINNNRFIACGYRADDMMAFDYKGFYTIIDSSGNFILFNKVEEFAEIRNVFELDNGNMMMVGIIAADYGYGFIEINPSGSVVNSYKTTTAPGSQQSYDGLADLNGVLYVSDGNWVQKLNTMTTAGCFNYTTTTFTYTGSDPGSTPSSGYVVVGSGGSITPNTEGILQTSTDLELYNGCIYTGIETNNDSHIEVYPTLLTSNQTIYIEHEIMEGVDYRIMDMNGRIMIEGPLNSSTISVHDLSAGMYVLQIVHQSKVVNTTKLVIAN